MRKKNSFICVFSTQFSKFQNTVASRDTLNFIQFKKNGDRLMFFSDGLPIQLPHSGLFLLPATVRMDYRDGCRHYDDCFEGIAQPGGPTATSPFTSAIPLDRLPISVVALEPDIVAPWTIEAWLTGNDPMMDAVATLVIEKAKQ